MKNSVKRVVALLALAGVFVPCSLSAQIPSGYVQTTATVSALANGTFGASWTNLSSSVQLGLLGCVSTFQTTVNGRLDSNGHFSVLLADTAQICPSPSTWTFAFTVACPAGATNNGFLVAIPVTGGGGTEDISTEVTAAVPTDPCKGSGGGGYLPLAGGTLTGALNGTSASFSGNVAAGTSVTAPSLIGTNTLTVKNQGAGATLPAIPTYAQTASFQNAETSVWTRGGAVLSGTSIDTNGVQEPTVIYDTNPQLITGTNAFKMIFTCGNNAVLCYAESLDGVTWTRAPASIAPGRGSFWLKNGSTYYLYTCIGFSSQLDLYTSTDGYHYTLAHSNVLPQTTETVGTSVANLSIVVSGGTWYMAYEARWPTPYSSFHGWSIGTATSTDGVTWTKNSSNPLISNAGGPDLYMDSSNNWWMWVHCCQLPTDFVKYTSTDFSTWTLVHNQLEFTRQTADEGAGMPNGQVADHSMVTVGGTTYLYYTASPNSENQFTIKVATTPNTTATLTSTVETNPISGCIAVGNRGSLSPTNAWGGGGTNGGDTICTEGTNAWHTSVSGIHYFGNGPGVTANVGVGAFPPSSQQSSGFGLSIGFDNATQPNMNYSAMLEHYFWCSNSPSVLCLKIGAAGVSMYGNINYSSSSNGLVWPYNAQLVSDASGNLYHRANTGASHLFQFWTGTNWQTYANVSATSINVLGLDVINSYGTLLPHTLVGQQGPASGYVQTAPAPSAAGYLYQNGSGTYSWTSPSASGTVNSGTAYSPVYYASTGTSVSGTTPFTGLSWWSSSAAPVAAISANVQSVIGAGVYDASGAASSAVSGNMSGNAATSTALKITGNALSTCSATVASGVSTSLFTLPSGVGEYHVMAFMAANDTSVAYLAYATIFTGTSAWIGSQNSSGDVAITVSGLTVSASQNAGTYNICYQYARVQ